MRYSPSELERLSMLFDAPLKQLEDEIMTDIVRRIKINGEITRSADWQIHRLYELGMSKQDIENSIQNLTGISPQEVQNLYSQVIQKGYAEDEKLYRLKGKPYIPFAENKPLQQFITATAMQTSQNMYNLTQSMGFAVRNTNGLTQFLPIAQYYQDTLDNAMLGITSGAFDYNTVLKKTVAQLTNSGLRTIDYASGHSNRVEVATRRAVMTGFNQIVAKVNEENAEKLGTEYFEVSYHGGARPTHQVWQGRVYSKKDLETVCGLGDVQGLCGANCYHSYSPFFPEIDVRTYTDEQLDEMNRQENTPVEYNGKKYTKYEALQRQRRLETTMRAERQKIKLLQEGGANEDDIITARAKYRVTSAEYTRFSKTMNLPQQRERVTIDGLGNIGVGKYKVTNNIHKPNVKNSTSSSVANSGNSGIMKTRNLSSRNLPNGLRTAPNHNLTDEEISSLRNDIVAIKADENVFKFNVGRRTGYDDVLDEIRVRGDVLPDLDSNHPRDRMSSRAALAHEYYGHRANRGTKVPNGAWNDEFRASYMAAKNCPNLSDEDRYYLILDALERAKESGVTIKSNSFIRSVLYGY